jgi:hypothetical protein
MESRPKNVEPKIKRRKQLIKAACLILMCVGAVSLLISIIYNFQTLAFIGTSLLFWGALLLYIRPEDYTKRVLLDAVMIPTLGTIDQMIKESGYKGKAIYLPPKYLNNSRTCKAYIPKNQKFKFPESEVITKQENKFFHKTPEGILLTPPGAELVKILEKKLKINFEQTDLQYLKEKLPKIFTQDLEIAEKVEIQIESRLSSTQKLGNYDTIKMQIANSIFQNTYRKTPQLSTVFKSVGSPLFSSMACALTKITGKPVFIENIQYLEGKTIVATYQIGKLEYREEAEAPQPETTELLASPLLWPKLTSLFLIILGSATLIWFSYIIGYDMFVWNKSLDSILFGSRAGELIDLGIGMKLIYYFVIGISLLASGLLLYLLSRVKPENDLST